MNPGTFFLYGLSFIGLLAVLFFTGLGCWLVYLYLLGKVKGR